MLTRTMLFAILATISTIPLPVQAETCAPIPVVGGQGNQVTKTVSQPTIPGPLGIDITRNNWNTDWAVPSENNNFRRYVVTLIPNDDGPYDIKMYLKYSDQTVDEIYNQEGVQMKAGKPLKIEAAPRPENQPYQVNLYVNGIESLGKTYTTSVVGCR